MMIANLTFDHNDQVSGIELQDISQADHIFLKKLFGGGFKLEEQGGRTAFLRLNKIEEMKR